MKSTLRQLQNEAIKLGATGAKIISVSSVVVDERDGRNGNRCDSNG